MHTTQVSAAAKIRVMVIDDSALVRRLLTEIINREQDLEVVGAAPDPVIAREMIKQVNPDVLTLDVEMPKMDGLEFLEKLMRLRPMPVLMISSLTERGSEQTLRALELGAVDFVAKPKLDIQAGLKEYAEEITAKLRVAARARVRKLVTAALNTSSHSADVVLPSVRSHSGSTEKVIVIGSSTGGTEALKEVLMRLPPDSPAVLVAQHMPAGFTKSFAQRLNGLCKIKVSEAVGGERVLPGHAYIAPGHSHLLLKRSGANYVTELSDGPPVNRHRPSVDVLFRSAANAGGKNIIGVMLTGMGKDGASGMLEMRNAGATNFAQDEATCVVYGMPREAVAVGAVHEVLPLQDIAAKVLQAVGSGRAIRV